MHKRRRFDLGKLKNFTCEVLKKIGIPERDAYISAEILLDSDLRGIESHGISHLVPFYVEWIKEGKVKINPELKLTKNLPTSANLDGDSGLGFIAGYHAMVEAINMARDTGAGFVSVKNSTHFGAATYYAMMPIKHDMIGIAMTVGGRIMMAPGSSKRAGGLNPIAIAVPAYKKHPFVLDMSTSVVAFGKIEIAKRQGKAIPEGWVVDEKGKSITDTTKINPNDDKWKGGILPLGGLPETGGFKGFGLAILIDIICTLLSGASLNTTANHFFGAIRIDGFHNATKFKKQMDQLIDSIESLPTISGNSKIYTAGGLEYEVMKERKKNGIPLDEKVFKELKKLSEDLNLTF